MSEIASSVEPAIPWERFVKFLRQLSHDLRNQLNAAELQAALLNELTEDAELKVETKRLREVIAKMGRTLQQLSVTVASPRPTMIAYTAADFVTDLKKKVERQFPGEAVEWQISSGEAMLELDPQLMEWVVLELFENAFRYRSGERKQMSVTAMIEDRQFIFELNEPKEKMSEPADFKTPLRVAGHGHYGLGLQRAQAIVAAHLGMMTTEFSSDLLRSRIALPLQTRKE